jgi:hypothetical protein
VRGPVLRQNVGRELLDSGSGGRNDQLADQRGGDATPLPRVGDDDRDVSLIALAGRPAELGPAQWLVSGERHLRIPDIARAG